MYTYSVNKSRPGKNYDLIKVKTKKTFMSKPIGCCILNSQELDRDNTTNLYYLKQTNLKTKGN